MKKGWQRKTLGEICDIERGGSPRPIQNFITNDPNGINWIKIGDATASGKYIYKTEEKIRPEGVKRSRMVYDGDFILSNSMSFGRPYIMKTTGCIHDGWLVLHQPKVDPDYLYYVLSSDIVFSQFDRLAAGSTVRNLNIGSAKSVEIPYPPLPEQQRIVGLLDEAFAELATAQAHAAQNLQNARALFESHLNAVFTQRGEGWVEKPLNAISTILNGYAFKSTDFSPKASVKCIKITNVGIRKFVAESDSYLPASFPKEYGAVAVNAGSIVIALTRTIIAGGLKVAVVPHEYNRALLNQRVAAIQTDAAVLGSDFLFAYLSTQSVADYVTQHVNTLMQPNLSIADLKALPIAVPSREEQTRITTQLDDLASETQRLTRIYEQKLAALAELKKSLLHQAFSGEL